MWKRIKWIWARAGDVFLAKDIFFILGGSTALGAVGGPVLVWIFTPVSPADLIVIALVCGLVAFGLAYHFTPAVKHIHHVPLQTTASPEASISIVAQHTEPVRDVWLQDAVIYAVHGRWLGSDEQAFSTDAQMGRAGALADEMRQLAYDGKFNVWGKSSPVGVFELIPQQFWADHQIDFLRLFGDDAENVKTERAGWGGEMITYRELMVSKAQTETRWPPEHIT